MTTRFSDKDPSQKATLEFDFTGLGTSVSNPTITVTVAAGADTSPDSIRDGAPSVVGAKVFQRVKDGVDGVIYALECLVDIGNDRHPIHALLPVINRPKVIESVPKYVTQAAFEEQFGVRELRDLMSGGNDYARAENAAAGLADGYIAAKYTLPLVSVPGMVRAWVADITRYRLWDEAAPEEVRRRYEDAIAQLRDLSLGKISLPPGADGKPAAPPLEFAGYSNARIFTEDVLKSF